ncbi:hypothetical protein C2S51_003893 [Perilla frutescens var. frutescens]|nr:hypothetical protein C2S51_003893 [Perilla frutescens var. frutescens]
MSHPSSSPQQEAPLDSDAVFGCSPSLNEEEFETPIEPTPLPKSDPETAPPEENSHGEEEDDDEEGEDIDEETTPSVSSNMDLRIDPPITDPLVSPRDDVTLASPTSRRGGSKRKGKGKGKGKGKPNVKKLQAIQEKVLILRSNLNPIPFFPPKIPQFTHHEKLLKKLGLWEFFQIDFERTIRVDLIAQLVATYNAKSRSSYVNNFRILVNRADLARAFKLPFKKEKSNAGGGEVELDWEILPDESVEFIISFVSDWMLLHEDPWLMPNEVSEWLKLIKEGHPEKVDWAGLLWFMVEKELKQGGQLMDCYYASHLQHLIKVQREDVFLMGEEPAKGEVESGAGAKEAEDVDDGENVKDSDAVESNVEGREADTVVEGPSTELTLGQDKEKEEEEEEGVKEVEMMDAESEKGKDSDEEGGGGREGEEQDLEQEPWLNGKNSIGEHFMQRCNSVENAEEFGSLVERKDEDDEEMDGEEDGEEDEDEEPRNNFHGFPDDDSLVGEGFPGNFLQGMEANQMAFSSHEQFRNASSVDARADVQHIASTPSFFNNSGKRALEHDYHHGVNDGNKRLRINETWDNKPLDLGMCFEQIQQMAQRARMLCEEKEQAAEQLSMNQQVLLNEVQKRDSVIEQLHKVRVEEAHKKDVVIGRLERELYLIGSVLDGYRKALKETRKAFAEYRERAQLPEEPTYKDAGPGGLMLTAAEIERRRKKKEEEFKMNCLLFEQKIRAMGDETFHQLDDYLDKTNLLDTKLIHLEAIAKELFALHSKRKIPPIEEKMPEVVESLPVLEHKEAVPKEFSEPLPFPEPEEHVPEAANHPSIPQTDEVLEVAETEPPSIE